MDAATTRARRLATVQDLLDRARQAGRRTQYDAGRAAGLREAAESLLKRWKLELEPPELSALGPEPVVGAVMYVNGAMYIDHGEDDRAGGLATIASRSKAVSAGRQTWFVEFEEVSGSFNYPMLLEQQEKLKREYGGRRAHPDPDFG